MDFVADVYQLTQDFMNDYLLLYFVRHINQAEPIEHPVDVGHSTDIT